MENEKPKRSNEALSEMAAGRCAVSMPELERAFTEWDRRYREEPERFMSEATHLLKETPETYGAACAPYFMKLIDDVKSGKVD